MKITLCSLLVTLFCFSCSTSPRISKSEDTSRSVKSMEMTDKLSAYPVEINGMKSSQKRVTIKTVHRFIVGDDRKINLSVEFMSAKFIPDSVVYLMLDGERIGISQRSDRQFEVPENLWIPIVHSSKIEYFLKIGMEDFDIRPNPNQTKNLNYFFERAIENRDAILPPLQEGMKKW